MSITVVTGQRSRKRRIRPWFYILLLFIVSGLGAGWWAWSNLPNRHHVTPVYLSSPHPIMLNGEWTQTHASGEGDGLLIPLSVGQKLIGDGILYEEKTDSVVVTTKTRVLHFKVGVLDATLNRKPFTLQFAAVKRDGTIYLPVAPLRELFGFRVETGAKTGIVTLLGPKQAVQKAIIPTTGDKGAKLREGADSSFAIVEDLPPGTAVRVWGESDGWYRAQSSSGHIGYLAKKDAALAQVETVPSASSDKDEPYAVWKAAGQRINLTWEAVYQNNPNAKKIGELPGVNVVSPTWFELSNGSGTIRSKADAAYSQWYRSKGVQVWALFSNGFEPERTSQALASYDTRLAMIQQLLAYAKTFKLQGINLDFENVKTSDKDLLVQFVREFSPLAHEQNLVVSMDVTPKSNSEFWSLFLDRRRLGETVDFMMVMAYDEHWASSPVAGSVSSLGWSEAALQRIIKEDGVAPHKLILGVPLYTRIWTETPDAAGGVTVSAKTMSMEAVAGLIADKKLRTVRSEDTGQNYLEFKEGNVTQKIWIEDAYSLQARMKLAKKYNLAGVATWARSFASPDVWSVMDRHLQSRP